MGSEPGSKGPDFDWYVLTLDGPTSQLVRIQLSPEDGTDFVLEWYPTLQVQPGETLKALANIDHGKGGEVEVLAPTVLGPGKHYFRVRKSRRKIRKRDKLRNRSLELSDRAYRLTTTVVESDSVLEREPNNHPSAAGVLRVDEARQGYLGWFGDSDWFRLDLENVPENALLTIELSGIPHVKSRLWVVDKRNRSFVKVPEAKLPWDDGQDIRLVAIPSTVNNPPLYVEVKTMRGANTLDRYNLSVTAMVPEGPHETEPNWRHSNATILTSEAPVAGYIGHPNDWDVFRIDSEDSKSAVLTVTGVPQVDLQIELLADKRTVTKQVNANGPGMNETMPAIPVGPLPAFVRLSSKDKSFNTGYAYQVSVQLTEAGSRESEPNNDYDSASHMPAELGKTIQGFITPQKDVDFYVFSVPRSAAGAQLFSVELRGAAGLRLALRLYDSEHVLITQKRGIGVGERRQLKHEFSPGKYFLQVLDESGQAANDQAGYLLNITSIPSQ
jgi:hypothetical protein